MFVMLAVAAIGFVACSKDDGCGVSGTGDMRVKIDPTIANPAVVATARATRATDTDFEAGDRMGLTVTLADGAVYLNNEELTCGEGGVFSSSAVWYEDVNAASTLFAYYPYQQGAAAPAEFAVAADQRGDGYAASDLIVGTKTGVTPTSLATPMTFKHKMARLIVEITENKAGSPIRTVEIGGVVCKASIDAATGVVTAAADAAPSSTVAHEATAEKLYYALVVPQNGVKPTVTVTTADNHSRTYSLATTDLKSGENRRLSTVVELADLSVTVSGPITGWEDGEDLKIEGGDAPEAPSVEWGGVKYRIVTLKDGRTWMAENLRYVPAGKTPSSDPTDGNGVWYPCNLDKTPDPSRVTTDGLLYSYPMLLGMNGPLSADNYDQYEGVQGICPDGWHVPTMAEWLKLAGQGSGGLSDPTSPYFEAASSGAPMTALNADGFNFAGTGYINAGSAVAIPAYMAIESKAVDGAGKFGMGYYASSTAYQITYNTAGDPASGVKNIQYYAGMITYNAQFNRLQVAFQGGYSAAPVRCIKNAE